MPVLFLIAGICLLVLGAETLVRGASRLAAAAGIAPVVVGLTVVAFGTSAPELAVSIKASLGGQGDIAVGNVVGSNIFNVLFILGASALVVPLVVTRQLIRLDVPVMIGVSAAALIMGLDDEFGRIEGVVLVSGLVVYVGFLVLLERHGKNAEERIETEAPGSRRSWVRDAFFVAGGLALLVLGSRWFVDSAMAIAQLLGVSQVVIGLTVVAVGTSMPEVVTSLVASVRGERDIAVGNVVGSNIFNVLGVLGLAAIVSADGIEVNASLRSFDMPVMIAVAFACFPIFLSGGRISRWEGVLLLTYYAAYTTYLLLDAAQHGALAGFSFVMVYFTIPLTVLTLLVIAFHAGRRAPR
jgi:cation:H+ antiporter